MQLWEITNVTGLYYPTGLKTGMMTDMGTFGDRLRRERETRGVTLGEISESTKISTGFLRALEQEDFDKLPGGIFNRGFVRAYCAFLGIEDESMVADFDAAYDQHRAEQIKFAPLVPIAPEKEPSKFPKFPIALLAPVLILLAAAAIWIYSNRKAAETGSSSTTYQPSSQDPSSHGQDNDTRQNVTTPADHSVNTAEQKKQNAIKPKSATKESVTDKAIKKVSADLPTNNTSERMPEAPPNSPELAQLRAPIRLDIRTHEDSWLSVVADGKTLMEGVLPAERSKTFRAQKNMTFTTGNAGGVDVSYNGKTLPSLGTSNEVKSLRFTPEGPRP